MLLQSTMCHCIRESESPRPLTGHGSELGSVRFRFVHAALKSMIILGPLLANTDFRVNDVE